MNQTTDFQRLDRYTILVNGQRVRATVDQESRIRGMTPEQLANFVKIMTPA